MKRIQLIDWGIVTIGLIFGFKFFEGMFSLFAQILYDFDGFATGSGLVKLLILCAAYAALFLFLIRKSAEIANWINGAVKNEPIGFNIDKHSLLQVVLIALCVATILSNMADIVLYLFETFKNEAGRFHEPVDTTFSKHRFKVTAIETIVAFVIMYFSKDISSWFIRKDKTAELTFESDPENKD